MTFGVDRGTTSAWLDSIPIGLFGKTKSLTQGGVTQPRKNTEFFGTSSTFLLTKNPYRSFGMALGREIEP
jgi:hypothetical protein